MHEYVKAKSKLVDSRDTKEINGTPFIKINLTSFPATRLKTELLYTMAVKNNTIVWLLNSPQVFC
jgi:hypothetical protein